MRRLTVLIAMLLLSAGWAAPAPPHHDSWGGHAHQYTFVGKLDSLQGYSATVTGADVNGKLRTIIFTINHRSQVASGLEPQDKVVVGYDYTTASNVYALATLNKLPAWKKAPRSTFPDLAPCATEQSPMPRH